MWDIFTSLPLAGLGASGQRHAHPGTGVSAKHGMAAVRMIMTCTQGQPAPWGCASCADAAEAGGGHKPHALHPLLVRAAPRLGNMQGCPRHLLPCLAPAEAAASASAEASSCTHLSVWRAHAEDDAPRSRKGDQGVLVLEMACTVQRDVLLKLTRAHMQVGVHAEACVSQTFGDQEPWCRTVTRQQRLAAVAHVHPFMHTRDDMGGSM